MATLQATGIADLVATTLNELGSLKFTDIMSKYQRTIVLKRTMKKNKIDFDAGPEVQFNLITATNGSAAFTGLWGQDSVSAPNVMLVGKAPFRHASWNWGIERREIAFNRSPRKIVDLAQTRRISAFGDAVILWEQRFWRLPATTDEVNPYGLPYWVSKSNTAVTTNDGFNGTVSGSYTTVGNISPTTYPRWTNYATQYTAISHDDLVRKMHRALVYTDFEPLVDEIPQYNTGDDVVIYGNYATVSAMEELLEQQNDNLGPDLASMDGKVMIRRIPITISRELDDDTTNPLYGINWGEFKAMGLRGEWMYETSIDIAPGQHTVSETFTDCSFNWYTPNRRRHFVLATNTTLMS